MNQVKKDRNSDYIKPLSYLIDLVVINVSVFLFETYITGPYFFGIYISLCWILIAFKINFYEIQRSTKAHQVLSLLFIQFVFYSLIIYAYIGFVKKEYISRLALGYYLVFVFFVITFIKISVYFLLNKYRSTQLGNFRRVIIIGETNKTKQLISIFNNKPEFGYIFKKLFSPKKEDFSFKECFNYVKEQGVDEIYVSVAKLSNSQISELIYFADNNLIALKFIPDDKYVFSKKLKFEYYDLIPVLSLNEVPLKNRINKLIKRSFDVLFSLFVILFLLSWFVPLIGLLIKLESKGPIFFKQMRYGDDFKLFGCYKFRSMTSNKESDNLQASKNDVRITRIGRFIRKTSIDELPQFYNVLFGTMSIVGPRPLMLSHTNDYKNKINKFMVRHTVKPGITGLAQVSGYRGNIEKDLDMLNRVRYDIFYIENWSLLLDLKIIIQTIKNVFEGEEKAY